MLMVEVEDLQRPQEEKNIEENCCGFNKHQDLILKSERTNIWKSTSKIVSSSFNILVGFPAGPSFNQILLQRTSSTKPGSAISSPAQSSNACDRFCLAVEKSQD